MSHPTAEPVVLAEQHWQSRRDAHAARVRQWTKPHQLRQARGERHPVLDFLFTYYSHRPARLERWNPGVDTVLAGPSAREYLDRVGYTEVPAGVMLDRAALPANRRRTAEFVLALLTATASRAPRLACFGLHEWAMVYRASPELIRHAGLPLRLGASGTDAVVETQRVRCSHYDAFRFYTPAAQPLNEVQPTRESQLEVEQPGCLHANMDLFKWAYKLDPFVPSELMADCFALALRIRELDMRASPYDLTAFGYEPVRIETTRGRAEYARRQAQFVQAATPLRARLAEVCRDLLADPR